MTAKHPWCAWAVDRIGCAYTVLAAAVLGLTDIHDRGRFGKKSLLYATLYITFTSLKWAFEYTISQTGKDGVGTAAVIGAVMLPISAMQAAVFKFYLNDSADQRRIDAGTPTTDVMLTAKTTGGA